MADERSTPTGGRSPLLLLAGLLALLACCCTASMGTTLLWFARKAPETASRVLGPEGGTVQATGVSVTIPKGALGASATLTLSPPQPAPSSPDRNLVVLGDLHRIELAGKLSSEAELTLEYDPTKLAGRPPEEVVALVFRGRGYEPVVPSRVDASAHRITVKTRHFSDWTTGVATSPATVARSHPRLPFDVKVVDRLREKLAPNFVDAVYRSIEKSYDTLTLHNPTRPWRLPEPPHAEGKRLVALVTDLAPMQHLYTGVGGAAAVTVSDELMLIGCDALPPDEPLWNEVVHEFVHAIQWRCQKRAQVLGKNARFLYWTAEATATYAAAVVVPTGLGDEVAPAPPLFCYEELTYESLTGPARPGSAAHQYEAHAFVAYLVARFGPAVLGDLIGEAFGGAATDVEALETVVKEASHAKLDLFQVYREFVRDHEFTRAFGSRKLHGLTPGTLAPPPEKTVTLEPPQLELQAGALMVPSAVRIPIPAEGGELDVTLDGSGWLWAFAGKTKLLGGHASRLSLAVDPGVREVFLLPVSGAPQTLVLRAKLAPRKASSETWVLTKRSPILSQEKLGWEPSAQSRSYQRFVLSPGGIGIDTLYTFADKEPQQVTLAFRVTKAPPARLSEGDPLELALEGKIEKAPETRAVDAACYFVCGPVLAVKCESRDGSGCRVDAGHREDRAVYRGRVVKYDGKLATVGLGVNLAPDSVSGSHWTLVTWEYERAEK